MIETKTLIDKLIDTENIKNISPIIVERTVELLTQLDIQDSCEVELQVMEHGTVEIEINEGAWKLNAEVGRTTANFYITAPDTSYTWDRLSGDSMEEMAEEIQKYL